jgi:hypothetical protein
MTDPDQRSRSTIAPEHGEDETSNASWDVLEPAETVFKDGVLTGVSLTARRFGKVGEKLFRAFGDTDGPPILRAKGHWPVMALYRLTRADFLANLEALWFWENGIGPMHAWVLARSSALTGLSDLSVGSDPLGDAGVRALLEAAWIPQLCTLRLQEAQLATPGLCSVFQCDALSGLRHLDVQGNGCDLHAMRALVGAEHLSALEELDLSHDRLGDVGVRVLAEAMPFRRLRVLKLTQNGIGEAGARALASAPHLASLRSLWLNANRLGPGGARAIAASPYLAGLSDLQLRHNRIGNEGAQAFVDAPGPRTFTTLCLNGNGIEPSFANALRTRYGDAVRVD